MSFSFQVFSEKQLEVIMEADAFINIIEGAVRSGKTIAASIAWMDFITNSPHNEFIMTGYTIDTLYRNVIDDLEKIYGSKRVRYVRSSKGGAKLIVKMRNSKRRMVVKTCYCLGANNERSENSLRGMTVGGWYADEVTLYPESFVKQAINRMSLAGARAFWTMNPDSPYHYIHTEFIEQAASKGFKHWHFNIGDNFSLDPTYVSNLRKSYSGLWYLRMVEGKWVMADGVIYDCFNINTMVKNKLPKELSFRKTWIGIDYGTSNATTFLFFGYGSDGRLYLLDEYYHSGSQSLKQKSPSKYATEFVDWAAKNIQLYQTPDWIFVDPSAEGFILELYNRLPTHLRNKLAKADNSVKLGIELVTNIIDTDRFRVLNKCIYTLKELTSYVWDPKAQKRGEDVPLKENDHCMDPLRYVANGTRLLWKINLKEAS